MFATLKRQLARAVFADRTFAVACRLAGPVRAGALCARFVEPHAGPDGPACLCIDRDVFAKDIVQLRARTRRGWPSIRQQMVFLCQQAWLPRWYFHQTRFQARLAELDPRAVEAAERFSVSFLRRVRERHSVGAILTGNVDYAPDEFLRRAAEREGMPFLVLLKEHANTGYGHGVFARSLAGYRFYGDGVAVFGPRTQTILQEEGVCPPERVRITGPPRFDEWADAAEPERRDVAVLFSFSRADQEGTDTFRAVLDAFVAAADASAGERTTFVVKCRDPYEEAVVRQILGSAAGRVALTSSTPVPEILRRSFAAVGFSSLGLTEALLSPATIHSPRFGTCRNAEDAQFDDRDEELRALVRFPSSPEELIREVIGAAGVAVPAEERRARERLVHRLFCAPRPTHSALVDAFVADAIARAP